MDIEVPLVLSDFVLNKDNYVSSLCRKPSMINIASAVKNGAEDK